VPDQYSPHHTLPRFSKIYFNVIQLRLSLPSGLFPSDFPTKILYAFVLQPFLSHPHWHDCNYIRRRVTSYEVSHCALMTRNNSQQQTTNSVAWVRRNELYRPSDRRLSAKLVPTLADRGCRVVSATNLPQSLISVFYTGAATVLSSSSSIILTRLSGPHSRPTTSEKIW
jgi:hypothetical protein